MSKPLYQMYRNTTLGNSLQETLETMIHNEIITPTIADRVLNQFDKSVSNALADKVKSRCSFRGELSCYRFCDNVWTLLFKNFELRDSSTCVFAEKVKIVACDGSVGKQNHQANATAGVGGTGGKTTTTTTMMTVSTKHANSSSSSSSGGGGVVVGGSSKQHLQQDHIKNDDEYDNPDSGEPNTSSGFV